MRYHVNVPTDEDLLNKKEEWKDLERTIVDRPIKIPYLYFYAHCSDL
jgi:hypothetical protein